MSYVGTPPYVGRGDGHQKMVRCQGAPNTELTRSIARALCRGKIDVCFLVIILEKCAFTAFETSYFNLRSFGIRFHTSPLSTNSYRPVKRANPVNCQI